MDRDGIVNQCVHPLLFQKCLKRISFLRSDDTKMKDMPCLLHLKRLNDWKILKHVHIDLGVSPSHFIPLIQIFQFDPKDCCLDLIQTAVTALEDMLIPL